MMFLMKTTRTVLAVTAVALLAVACSLGKVAYNNASPVLTWMADDYFDLSGGQEQWVRGRLAKAIDWHRGTELPEYQRFLREALTRTERPVTLADARWAHSGLRAYYQRLATHLLPDAADFIAQLEPDQAGHFERRFGEESQKIVRQQLPSDPAEREARRLKKMISQIETYTGRLNPQQREYVAGRVHVMTDVTELRLEDRKARQQRIVNLVRSKPAKPEMIAELKRVFIETESWRKPEYVAKMKERDEQLLEMTVGLAAMLTPEQKANVQRKLRAYLSDVTSLMAQR